MINVAKKLQDIADIGSILCADDITIWATKGSLAQKEQALQEVTNWVEKLARDNGLECAPEKSEVIRVHDAR